MASINFDELNTLSQQYPFASLFHTLVAKKAYHEKPHEYDVFLTKAAMYALDRKKLYYIIHDEKAEKKKHSITEETEKVEIAEASETIRNIDAVDLTEQESTIIPIEKEAEEAIPFIAGSFINTEEVIIDNIVDTPVVEAVEVSPTISEEKEVADKKHKKKKKKAKKKEKEGISPNTQLSFTEWLKVLNKNKIVSLDTEADDEVEDEESLENQYHAGKFEAQLHKQIAEEPEVKTPAVPKMPANWKKASDVKAEVKISDLAQKSIQRDENTITETLAKILELQKHYDKAIDAYEKLSLKYPEKSSYFATRILELKKKL